MAVYYSDIVNAAIYSYRIGVIGHTYGHSLVYRVFLEVMLFNKLSLDGSNVLVNVILHNILLSMYTLCG